MKLNIFITIIFSQLLLSQNAVEYKNIVFNDDQLYCFLEDKYILSKKVFLNIKLNYDSLKSINCNKYMIYKKEYYCYENSTLFSGIAREYKKNGTIKRQYEYKEGILISKSYVFKNTENISYKIELDSLGFQKKTYSYYMNGVLRSSTEFKNGKRNGIYKQFFQDGTLYYECNYLNNKKHGKSVIYDENGEKVCEIEFKNGKKHGERKVYCSDNENDVLITEYRNGKKIKDNK